MKRGIHFLLVPTVAWVVGVTATSVVGQKNYPPGITEAEIKIGQTMPYSGPASAWGTIGLAETALFKMINDQGGIHGRKINLITLDDAFSPPKTVEQTRRLVEDDDVAVIFGSVGLGNIAVRRYLNDRRIPQLFVLGPPQQLDDPLHFPWTIGIQPTFYLDGLIHARHILAQRSDARIGILYENDDYGKEHVRGFKAGLGDKAVKLIIKELPYEISDPTVDSQIVALKDLGVDTFYNVAAPKFAAQAIRKAGELGWKPLQFLTYTSQSISAVLEPAGLQNSIGIISATAAKDPSDTRWKDDPYTKEFLDWKRRYYPSGSATDIFILAGYFFSQPLIYVLKQCGDDLSRERIMYEATHLHDVAVPGLLPGITLNTSPTDYQPIKGLRETRFNGKTWELLNAENEGPTTPK